MYRIGIEEIEAITRVINSKNFFKCNDGLQETMHCEKELRALFNCREAILMTSGKGAVISSLTALGVGPGDEVIVPAYTYIATAIAVTATGAIPVIADVDSTLTLDVNDAERKISKHTKAIIPVHIQGFPCNMDAICDLAKKHNIYVVEDACQADGGAYKGRRLGTIGDLGALSFNHYKIISAGEGGAVLTNNRTFYERAFIFHDSSAIAYFGGQLDNIEEPQFCGNEYRTNEIAAAILREQLKKLDGILFDLRKNKKNVMDALSEYYTFIPSNDIEGDCGTTLAFRFEDEKTARTFARSYGINGVLPIDTGKHVYTHWTPILEKQGAFHDAMNPFKMKENQGLNYNYSKDMCMTTLDLLSRTVYMSVNPDWTDADIYDVINFCIKAKELL